MTLFLTAEGRNPKRKLGSATFGLGDAADRDLHWAICIGRSALGVCELGVCELGVCELGVCKLGVCKLGVCKLGLGDVSLSAGRPGDGPYQPLSISK